MEGPGADSEEKRVLASDLDTVMVDSLKALDLIRPIREADITGLVEIACDRMSGSIIELNQITSRSVRRIVNRCTTTIARTLR